MHVQGFLYVLSRIFKIELLIKRTFTRNQFGILANDLKESKSGSHSVVSNSLWPRGLYSPWDSPGQNTGVGSISLLQGIFSTQKLNPGLLHCKRILYQLSHKERALLTFPWSFWSEFASPGFRRCFSSFKETHGLEF